MRTPEKSSMNSVDAHTKMCFKGRVAKYSYSRGKAIGAVEACKDARLSWGLTSSTHSSRLSSIGPPLGVFPSAHERPLWLPLLLHAILPYIFVYRAVCPPVPYKKGLCSANLIFPAQNEPLINGKEKRY